MGCSCCGGGGGRRNGKKVTVPTLSPEQRQALTIARRERRDRRIARQASRQYRRSLQTDIFPTKPSMPESNQAESTDGES